MPRPTGSAVLPPDRAGSPGSLIVSFAGLYLRELGGWIAVADLIRCLRTAGVSESSVRQALVRLKSRDFLAAERRSGEAHERASFALRCSRAESMQASKSFSRKGLVR